MNHSKKYHRSLHARISLGTTSDDRFMPKGYVKAFAEITNEFLMSAGYLAGAHAPSCPIYAKTLEEQPMWSVLKAE